jgi:hypothetical protein
MFFETLSFRWKDGGGGMDDRGLAIWVHVKF